MPLLCILVRRVSTSSHRSSDRSSLWRRNSPSGSPAPSPNPERPTPQAAPAAAPHSSRIHRRIRKVPLPPSSRTHRLPRRLFDPRLAEKPFILQKSDRGRARHFSTHAFPKVVGTHVHGSIAEEQSKILLF